MLSSKELMEKANVSRATLNNYIGMGLIPKLIVKISDSADDKARLQLHLHCHSIRGKDEGGHDGNQSRMAKLDQ